MKKLFALVALLFATLLSHAQITLEHTLTDLADKIISSNFGSNVKVFPLGGSYYPIVIGGNYLILTEFADDGNAQYDPTIFTNVYNLNDYSLEFSVNIEQTFGRNTYIGPYVIAKNIFTTDSKFAYICRTVTEVGYNGLPRKGEFKVISQDGNILASMPYTCKEHGSDHSFCYLVKVGERYKLIVENNQDDDGRYDYDIYSLPGNGEATAINEVYAPRRNARKYIHDAQVLIENEKNTYTIQGQEIK